MAGSLLIDQRSLWVAETNCYIVAPEPRGPAVVVDAPPDPEGIGALLAEHDLTPIALLVTHGHIDHAGGAGGVVRATGVPAYVHPDDDFLTLHPADQLRMLFGVTISDDRAAPFAPPDRYEALADGQSLELAGLRFDVLHTPGHTPGHCCFLLRDEGILFSGDQLFAGSIGRTDLPGGDYDTLMSSMADKVLPLPENTEVLPGHGPATTLARERLINPFLQELTGREPVWALPPPGDRPPQQHRGARPMGIEPLRTVHAGDLRAADADLAVHVAGWAERIRDQGGVTFVTLRDASGIVQVVFRPDVAVGAMEEASTLKREYCIAVRGVVKPRPTGTENPDLPTGSVEIEASEIEVLSPAETLPFQLDGRVDVTEERRLQYRYLDLRTPRMATNLKNRAIAIRMMRRVLDDKEFLEVETPTLIASTPEGARDMLVPSRLRKGQFYALPQSPQLFKQLLMIGGVERYYQVARCYRDEDFRADRQVEFTQLDLEGSFWGQDEVLATLEDIAVAVVKGVRDVDLARPFPRMTYADAMARYGTDKPDIRFGMEIEDLSTVFADTEFRAFAGVLTAGGVVRGINIGSREMSRSALDAAAQRAQDLGAAGLVWMVVQPDGTMRSPVAKFLGETELGGLKDALGATSGDVLLIVADQPRVVATTLGQLRVDYGQPRGHADLEFLFVVNFPVFEVGNDGSMVPAHHAFTAPVSVEEMRTSPETAISKSYDMVLNGSELGSGSVRIHDPQVQAQVFELLGISAEDAERRFGWFLEALRYGTPPHAGFAIGVDRMVSIMQGEPNIREVIPFPKTQTGSDPLTGSPSRVETEQLGELGIEVRPEVRATWEDADTQ